jgi:hypothetical protein
MNGPKPKLYECNGRNQTLKQWSAELGLSHACLTSRIRYGIPLDRQLHAHPTRDRVGAPAVDAALSNWLRSPVPA